MLRSEEMIRRALLLAAVVTGPGVLAFPADPPAAQKSDTPKTKAPASVPVSGKVVDRDGKGIGNAEVIFAGSKTAKTTTDAQGAFNQEVAPGKYTVTAKSGAKTKTVQVDIGKDSRALSLILE